MKKWSRDLSIKREAEHSGGQEHLEDASACVLYFLIVLVLGLVSFGMVVFLVTLVAHPFSFKDFELTQKTSRDSQRGDDSRPIVLLHCLPLPTPTQSLDTGPPASVFLAISRRTC